MGREPRVERPVEDQAARLTAVQARAIRRWFAGVSAAAIALGLATACGLELNEPAAAATATFALSAGMVDGGLPGRMRTILGVGAAACALATLWTALAGS